MFAPVVENVDQCIAHFTWRAKRPRVVTITPHASGAPKRAVDGLRDPDRESLDTALEPRRLVRLYQQMQMIRLEH